MALLLLPPPPPESLLLLARFGADASGNGGARPAGGFPRPGMGGAPPTDGPPEGPELLSNSGAERSLVTAFLSFAPFVISPSRAPWER